MKTNNLYRVCFIILIVIMVILVLAVSNKSTFKDNSNYSIESYTVKYGDSLWSIGKDSIGEHADIREWIYSVKDLNNITSEIHPGDEILIYTYAG